MMKKNYIYISIPIILLVLFFSLIYRSSKDKIEGAVDIYLSLASDSLSNEEKDSLVTQLTPLYPSQNQNTYYFSTIQFLDSDKTKIDVPTSMINKIRGIFSHSFYTSEERINANSLFIKNYPSIADKYRKAFVTGKTDESKKIKIYFSKSFKNLSESQANSISSLRLKIEEAVKKNPGKQILICHVNQANGKGQDDNPINHTNQNGNTNNKTVESKGDNNGSVENSSNGGNSGNNSAESKGDNNGSVENSSNGGNSGKNSAVNVLKNNSTAIDFDVVDDYNTFTLSNLLSDVSYSYQIKCLSGCKGNDYSSSGYANGKVIKLYLKSESSRINDRKFEIIITTTSSDGKYSRTDSRRVALVCGN